MLSQEWTRHPERTSNHGCCQSHTNVEMFFSPGRGNEGLVLFPECCLQSFGRQRRLLTGLDVLHEWIPASSHLTPAKGKNVYHAGLRFLSFVSQPFTSIKYSLRKAGAEVPGSGAKRTVAMRKDNSAPSKHLELEMSSPIKNLSII